MGAEAGRERARCDGAKRNVKRNVSDTRESYLRGHCEVSTGKKGACPMLCPLSGMVAILV